MREKKSAYTIRMPAAYTHFSVAAEVFRRLPEEIRGTISSLRLYFFGAQGADFCFFYRAFRASEINFGRFLHNRGSFDFFKALLLFSDRNSDLFSYALGYITHYAADCIFHPYVYYLSGHSPVKHSRAEGALDFYFREKSNAEEPSQFQVYFNAGIPSKEASELFTLYAVATAKAERDPLIKGAFLKSIRNFRAYTRFSAHMFAKKDTRLLNAERHEWQYPDDKNIVMTDGAEQLFVRAVEESISLIKEFVHCSQTRKPLKKELFGKNFLSGL